MISRQELLIWLTCTTFGEMIQRTEAFADCITDGQVSLVSNKDEVLAIELTPVGYAAMLPVLPATSA
jgi:hypothetical protein